MNNYMLTLNTLHRKWYLLESRFAECKKSIADISELSIINSVNRF